MIIIIAIIIFIFHIIFIDIPILNVECSLKHRFYVFILLSVIIILYSFHKLSYQSDRVHHFAFFKSAPMKESLVIFSFFDPIISAKKRDDINYWKALRRLWFLFPFIYFRSTLHLSPPSPSLLISMINVCIHLSLKWKITWKTSMANVAHTSSFWTHHIEIS